MRKPPFDDVRARQAVVQALDLADMSKVMDNGVLEPQDSVFRKDSPFYDKTALQLPYDKVKSQQLFNDLARDKGGPLTFSLSTFNTGNYVVASQYIQGVLSKFDNVKMTIDSAQSAVHQSRVLKGEFTAALFAQPFDDPEPIWTTPYTCGAAASPTGYCNAKFDALINDQRETLDPAKRVQDIKDAQKIFYPDVPAFYFQRRAAWLFTQPNVQDLQWVNDGLAMFDRMWIKTH